VIDQEKRGPEIADILEANQEGAMKKIMFVILVLLTLPTYGANKATTTKGTDMHGFIGDIEDLTEKNNNFRQVLYTGKNIQLVLMSLKEGEEIGEEVHADRDQFFRIEKGKGEVLINGKKTQVEKDDAIIVPAGSRHNVINTGKQPLQLYTLYGPPAHVDGTIHKTKADAEASEEHFDGKTSEPYQVEQGY
jgi:mannose-6-phosphate isomerase-like protein (cupin superfamily)